MANPRQRRKQRSNHKPVRHSNRAKRNLKKMPPLRAPKALRDAWDSHLTVKQNYTRLGLLATLDPRAKGGSENVIPPVKTRPDDVLNSTETNGTGLSTAIPRGYGKIIRDTDGNVVDVQMSEQDVEVPVEEDEAMPILDEQTERWLGKRTGQAESTAFVQGLESLSQCAVKVPRTVSAGERAWLKDIIAKYGDDFEKAARDRRLNPWQRTAAEIKRSLAKAGGKSKLLKDP